MTALSGIGGTLLSGRFLAQQEWPAAAGTDRQRRHRHLERWWTGVEAACGPATGLHALVDQVATPLAGMLGFRARETRVDRTRAFVTLDAGRPRDPAAHAPTLVGMLVLPWSSRPSAAWRDLVDYGREIGAAWGFVLAPPHLSVVDLDGRAVRRSIDFTLPSVFEATSLRALFTIAAASSFVSVADAHASIGPPRIERLVAASAAFGDSVRRDLQSGVIDALSDLVPVLRGVPPARFDEALVVIFRVLFLLFAESRQLVPTAHPTYARSYTIGALCRQALDGRRSESAHDVLGLWDSLGAMTRLSRTGCETGDLIVRPFNGRLFARQAAASLEPATTASRTSRASTRQDHALASVLLSLGTRRTPGARETIDYADLGVEQLGGVYEHLLDVDRTTLATRSTRAGRHSSARKATGTFYTPSALCDFLVRRTLTPLVHGRSSDEILSLRVVDPAMGSGAFLVSACRFLAGAYEDALIDEGGVSAGAMDEPSRSDLRRLVAERCLYGVDANRTAVQLARLSLWLATLAHGKPLTFLDHRLRTGNSLIGTSPDRIGHVIEMRRSPARGPSLPLFDLTALDAPMRDIVRPLAAMASRRDDTVADVRAKEAAWTALTGDESPLMAWRRAADAWCARWFVDRALTAPETRAVIANLIGGDRTLPAAALVRRLSEVARTAEGRGFFHWPLEFPEIFYDDRGLPRDTPGFDAVIGNPPWEMLRRDDKAAAPKAIVDFVRQSGLYPASDRGHLNLYQPFLERSLDLVRRGGRVGLVLPWGLAVDDGAASLRARLFDTTSLDVVVGLDNAAGLFPIHRGLRFLAVVTRNGGQTMDGRGRFGVRTVDELERLPGGDTGGGERPWPVRFATRANSLGGSTRRIPDARRPGDVDLADRLARALPRLGSADGWSLRFGRELNASEDKAAFGSTGLPVIDGKHVTPFAVASRAGRARISRVAAERALPDRRFEQARLAYRDVSGVGNRVSLIAAIVPAGVVTTHTLFCLRTRVSVEQQHYLCACFNSYVLNAIVRLLMGGHVTTSLVEGLPLPTWRGSALERRIARLGRRLSERDRVRSADWPRLEASMQAAVARRVGVDAHEFERLLEGFPLVPAADRLRAIHALAAAPERHVFTI